MLWVLAAFCLSFVKAENIIEASALFTCMDNSLVSANYFKVSFSPNNRTVTYDVSIASDVQGYVQAEVEVYAYGIKIITENIDPCKVNIGSFCPLVPGALDIQSSSQIKASIINDIPGVAYTVPDIDVTVIFRIKDANSTLVACIEADLTNRKTVEHTAVKWVTAVVSGIGLVTSAIVATLGSSLSSAQVAANAVSLFTYFQSVVIITMCAVDRVPPIASAWAQNLAWSVGIIRINFMQKIFRWYVQATGGTPDTYILQPTISVLVQKRNVMVGAMQKITHHSRDLLHTLSRRLLARDITGYSSSPHSSDTLLVMRGIDRVAYQADIENTSVVLTAFTFFVLICLAIGLCFVLFYAVIMLLLKTRVISGDRLVYFRANWRVMLKGTILRILFIACPSLFIFSMWEFLRHDSAAVIVLAVFFFALSLGILGWSIYKVFLIGRQSTKDHGTPAYLLFSDTRVLNRYGFLYVPFKASAYSFLIPALAYMFVKACFVAFAQNSGKIQAVALFILELAYFITICYYRPYMDRKTNAINIAIGAVMLVNAMFFLFFSEIFHQPRAVSSIMGVVFFVLNAAFALILLLFTLVTCTMALLSKNPDSRYKPVRDDRASFIQDQKHIPSDAAELTALGAAVRADHDEAFVPGMGGHHRFSSAGSVDSSIGLQTASQSKESINTYLSLGVNPFSEKNEISVSSREHSSSISGTLEYPNSTSKPSDAHSGSGTPDPSAGVPTFDFLVNDGGQHYSETDSAEAILKPDKPKSEKDSSPGP